MVAACRGDRKETARGGWEPLTGQQAHKHHIHRHRHTAEPAVNQPPPEPSHKHYMEGIGHHRHSLLLLPSSVIIEYLQRREREGGCHQARCVCEKACMEGTYRHAGMGHHMYTWCKG